jgi:prepilin-type N-terminal cleavage/methylation domain-containing protein
VIVAGDQPSGTQPCPRDQGFSLIETLIALAVVAAMTAALVGTTGQAARTRLAVQQRREALLVAQSALDQMADATAPNRGQWRGYTWSVSREPFQLADPLDRHPLEQMTVVVSGAGASNREIVRLSTVRIKP